MRQLLRYPENESDKFSLARFAARMKTSGLGAHTERWGLPGR